MQAPAAMDAGLACLVLEGPNEAGEARAVVRRGVESEARRLARRGALALGARGGAGVEGAGLAQLGRCGCCCCWEEREREEEEERNT